MSAKHKKYSNKKIKKIKEDKIIARKSNYDIDLHGYDIEEAIYHLDYYLTNIAFLSNKKKIYVNHGKGTFKLAPAIHEYLERQSDFIKSYDFAPYYEGGRGVTIICLDI